MDDKNFIEKFNSKIKKVANERNIVSAYSVRLTLDYCKLLFNKVDHIPIEVIYSKSYFDNNFTLKLVLAYCKGYKSTLYDDEWCGCLVGGNRDIPELHDFLFNEDLIEYSDYDRCHSISRIEIRFYDENGLKHNVTLPTLDELFETKEDAIKTLNHFLKLYNQEQGDNRE
jgi:hypothetical protein